MIVKRATTFLKRYGNIRNCMNQFWNLPKRCWHCMKQLWNFKTQCLKHLWNCLTHSWNCLKRYWNNSEIVWNCMEHVWNCLNQFWNFRKHVGTISDVSGSFWDYSEAFLKLYGSTLKPSRTFFEATMKPFWTCFLALHSGWMQQRGAPLVLATRTALKLMSLLQPFGPLESACSTACASESGSTPGRSTVISSGARLGGNALNAGYLELFEFARAMSSVLRLVLKSQTFVSSSDSLDLYKI